LQDTCSRGISPFLKECDQGFDVLELDGYNADVFAVLTDETLASLIPHVGGDAGAEAVRTDLNHHRSLPSPRMQAVDVTVSTAGVLVNLAM